MCRNQMLLLVLLTSDDILRLILAKMDVKTLFRTKQICRRIMDHTKNDCLHAAVLNTFPNMQNLPTIRPNYGLYMKAIHKYYSRSKGIWSNFKYSEFNVSIWIAACIARRHANYKPAAVDNIIDAVMKNQLWMFMQTDADRRFVIGCARDWRASCSLYPAHFMPNAAQILDGISSIAMCHFLWKSDGTISCYW